MEVESLVMEDGASDRLLMEAKSDGTASEVLALLNEGTAWFTHPLATCVPTEGPGMSFCSDANQTGPIRFL